MAVGGIFEDSGLMPLFAFLALVVGACILGLAWSLANVRAPDWKKGVVVVLVLVMVNVFFGLATHFEHSGAVVQVPLFAFLALVVGACILGLACSLVNLPVPGWKKRVVVVLVLVLVNVFFGLAAAYVIETVRVARKKAVAAEWKNAGPTEPAKSAENKGQAPDQKKEPAEITVDPLDTFRPLTFFRGLILFLVYLPVNAAVCLLLLKTTFLDGVFISFLNLLLGTLTYFLYCAIEIVMALVNRAIETVVALVMGLF